MPDVKITLAGVNLIPSNGNISPTPPAQAAFKFELTIGGRQPLELVVWAKIDKSMDEALRDAQAQLEQIGMDISEAAKIPILPLPIMPGVFGR